MSFPSGDFFIRNCKSGLVLDDKDMSHDAGTPIIDYQYKPENNLNQRWTCRDNRLLNKYSNLYFSFKNLTPESTATQEGFLPDGQQFKYNNGIISLMNDDNRVVGAWDSDVKIVKSDPRDAARRWDIESVHT